MSSSTPQAHSFWRYSYTVALLSLIAIASAVVAWPVLNGTKVPFADREFRINDLRSAKPGSEVDFLGVVTFSDPATRVLYIQDETAGIRLTVDGSDALPAEKHRVRVRAHVSGEYDSQLGLRSVELQQIRVIGSGGAELPAPESLRISDLLGANSLREARRIETQGIVRAAQRVGSDLVLELADAGQRATVHIFGASSIAPAAILDTRVQVRGALQLEADNSD